MALFDDSAEAEIRRLKKIIAKLEETKGVRVVTVEWEPKPGYGYLFYISAPTTANEKEFGLALADAIRRSFKVIGLPAKFDVARETNELASQREIEIEQSLSRSAATDQPIAVAPSEPAGCYLTENAMGRWIIVNARNPELAWSGTQWVPHRQGIPTRNVHISNFEMKLAAFRDADRAGLAPQLKGFRADGKSITCFRCGKTSYNDNDVQKRYCGFCHVFHETT